MCHAECKRSVEVTADDYATVEGGTAASNLSFSAKKQDRPIGLSYFFFWYRTKERNLAFPKPFFSPKTEKLLDIPQKICYTNGQRF